MLNAVSPMSLFLILLIVLVLFGGKRLRELGGDLGVALRSFRKGMHEDVDEKKDTPPPTIAHHEEQK